MTFFSLNFSTSPVYAAGQQCCYDSTGAQILTQDSTGGSTPDRGHDWGSPPFMKPPRIPGFSHWLYDVISFYYCCLWSDNCHFYMKNRPSSDCRTYHPPRAGKTFRIPLWIIDFLYSFVFQNVCVCVLFQLRMWRAQYPVENFHGRFQLICQWQNLCFLTVLQNVQLEYLINPWNLNR